MLVDIPFAARGLSFTVGIPAAQILYYRTESMAEKVQYLRSIGISKDSMPGVLTRLPQLLSLDIKGNMVPKYNYLQQQLGGNSATVSGYPAYFSLSLMQRCGRAHSRLDSFMHSLDSPHLRLAECCSPHPGTAECCICSLLQACPGTFALAARWRQACCAPMAVFLDQRWAGLRNEFRKRSLRPTPTHALRNDTSFRLRPHRFCPVARSALICTLLRTCTIAVIRDCVYRSCCTGPQSQDYAAAPLPPNEGKGAGGRFPHVAPVLHRRKVR